MPEGEPLQSLSRLPGWPTVWRSAPTSRGSFALRRRPSTGPRMQRPGSAGSPRFRPRGFSPPRRFPGSIELAGLFRPAAVPGLQSPFRAFPSRSGRAPLVGAAGSLAVLPGRTPVRRARSCHPRPSPTRATFGRRPWPDPVGARGSLSAPRTDHLAAAASRHLPVTLDLRAPDSPRSGRSVDFEAFFPARVRSHRPHPHGWRGGRCSPGRPRPSRALLPPSLGPSHPPRPEASLLPLAARASRRDARPPGPPRLRALLVACAASAPLLEDPRRRVDSAWTTETSCAASVGGHRADPARAVLPFGSSLDSHDLR